MEFCVEMTRDREAKTTRREEKKKLDEEYPSIVVSFI